MLVSRSLKGGTKVISLSSSSSSTRMRYSMRFVVFPFSLAACGSNSNVAVRKTHDQSGEAESEVKETALTRRKVEKRSKSGVQTKTYSKAAWAVPRPSIAARMQRLIRGIKCFPHIFVYKEEEEVKEMEIGLPTDVKHVTHIGLDGLNTNNIVKVLDSVGDPAKQTSLPTISLDEYETAMAAQARAPLTV